MMSIISGSASFNAWQSLQSWVCRGSYSRSTHGERKAASYTRNYKAGGSFSSEKERLPCLGMEKTTKSALVNNLGRLL